MVPWGRRRTGRDHLRRWGLAAALILMGAALPIGSAAGVTSSFSNAATHRQSTGVTADSQESWVPTQAPLPSLLPSGLPAVQMTLSGTACSSAAFCVSVGVASDEDSDYFPIAETLTNGSWVPSVLPQPPDASTQTNASPILASVSCPSDGSCAAVGDYNAVDASNGQSYSEPLLEVFSDGVWTATEGQLPNGPYSGLIHLYSVSCPIQGTCTAVGEDTDFSGPQVSFGLIYSLSFGVWQLQIAPVPADYADGTVLSSVSCPSSDSCVVVGRYQDADDDGQGLIETLSSGVWNASTAPLPANAAGPPTDGGGSSGNGLTSVDCPQMGTCLAGGFFVTASDQIVPLLENLASTTWTPSEAPLPANADLGEPAYSWVLGVSCPAENSCVATGFYDIQLGIPQDVNEEGFILTQSGGTWSAMEAPLPVTAGSDHRRTHRQRRLVAAATTSTVTSLGNVACGSDGFCNAVGTDEGTSFMESGQLSVPSISGVTPNSGPLSGGTTVTVTGSNFTPATTVSFGDTPATTTTFENGDELQVMSPAGSYGPVNIITSDGGLVSRANDADVFSYQSPDAQATAVSVVPSVAPIVTGQPVVRDFCESGSRRGNRQPDGRFRPHRLLLEPEPYVWYRNL